MAIATMPEVNEKLIVPGVSSSYPTLGAAYKHGGYEIDYAPRLVRTSKNYSGFKEEIPEGMRMSTAGEELALQLPYEILDKILKRIKPEDMQKIAGRDLQLDDMKKALESYCQTPAEMYVVGYVLDKEKKIITDPRKAKIFDDILARGPEKTYMWQWTGTFVRKPKSKRNPAKPDYVDTQGRKYWAREFGNGDEIVGVVYIPEGNGRVVPKTNDLLDVWDLVTGLPRITSDNSNDMKYGNHTTHFFFNESADEVAVGRWGGWRLGGHGGCLGVGASYGRSAASSDDGFRPVRGSLPKIEKEIVEKPVVKTSSAELVQQLDPAQIEQALLERLREDYRSMTHPEFLEKYDL